MGPLVRTLWAALWPPLALLGGLGVYGAGLTLIGPLTSWVMEVVR